MRLLLGPPPQHGHTLHLLSCAARIEMVRSEFYVVTLVVVVVTLKHLLLSPQMGLYTF